MEGFFIVLSIVGSLIWGLIWGYATSEVIKNKNYMDYESWFWWGFFFGLIAFVIASSKDQAKASYSSGPTHLTAAAKKSDEAYLPKSIVNNIPANGWKCRKCGKGNEGYTGTCACGNTKRENIEYINQSVKKSEELTKEVQIKENESVVIPDKSIADAILVMKGLLDSGAITQEEYDLKKKQLLGL